MFRSRVIEDLSHASGRLAGADEILERHIRRLVRGFIIERHSPRKSDLSPIGEILVQMGRGIFAGRRGDDEEAKRSTEALNRLSSDPHYRQRNQLNEAINIVENIEIEYLFHFFQATKISDLATILPSWRQRIRQRVFKYKKGSQS